MNVAVTIAVANGLWLAYVSQHNIYSPRAMVMEALNLGGGVKAAVAEFYADNGRFPADNAETGLSQSNLITGKFVSDVSVIANGVVQITLGGRELDETLAGKIIVLQAIVDKDSNGISWTCTAEHLAIRHLPRSCR